MNLNRETIAALRLHNQGLLRSQFREPYALVRHMGAMQAQDFAMSRWAVGMRVPGLTDRDVLEALDSGKIIRTHMLRPTWHLVAAEDVRWMMALTAPAVHGQLSARHEALGLTAGMLKKSTRILQDALSGGRSATRSEIVGLHREAGIANTDNRLSHLLMRAEHECLICSGSVRGNETTYALMDDRVPRTTMPDTDTALQTLALRYFTSHGPATLADFTWWSGLNITRARRAVDLAKSGLRFLESDGQTYWMALDTGDPVEPHKGSMLIPAYDELIISYKDRSAVLDSARFARAVSSNGIFYPVILRNGKVAGLWKRAVIGRQVHIETEFYSGAHSRQGPVLEEAIGQYLNFLNGQASKTPDSRI
jgi:hypothetical protein